MRYYFYAAIWLELELFAIYRLKHVNVIFSDDSFVQTLIFLATFQRPYGHCGAVSRKASGKVSGFTAFIAE